MIETSFINPMNTLDSQIYAPKQRVCPLCHSTNLKEYGEINRFTPPFYLSQCQSCEHIFMNPQWLTAQNERQYNEAYFAGQAQFSYHDERTHLAYEQIVWRARLKKIKSIWKKHNPSFAATYKPTLLDIGCSFGGFLQTASLHFRTYGVELSQYAAHYAATHSGGEIFRGQIENAPWPDASMDIITAIEVVEHIPNPQLFFQAAGRLLRPGGLLILQTADFHGWQAIQGGLNYHYFLPGHLHYYNRINLRKMMTYHCQIHKFYEYRGVEFGLWPKLRKARGKFTHWKDYFSWLCISLYHWKSKIRWQGHYLTSGFVLFGWKAPAIQSEIKSESISNQ